MDLRKTLSAIHCRYVPYASDSSALSFLGVSFIRPQRMLLSEIICISMNYFLQQNLKGWCKIVGRWAQGRYYNLGVSIILVPWKYLGIGSKFPKEWTCAMPLFQQCPFWSVTIIISTTFPEAGSKLLLLPRLMREEQEALWLVKDRVSWLAGHLGVGVIHWTFML